MTTRVGVIGCGAWGKNLVRNMSELGHLVAVADHDMSLAQEYAKQYGVKALAAEDLLADDAIDAVVIVSWAPYHFAQARLALENGKHVYVEKPLAMTSNEARILTRLAEDNNLTLMAGHILQYHPVFVQLRKMVEDGDIGAVRHVTTTRQALGRFRYHENAFWDLAPHDLSMVLSLVKSPVQFVQAFGHSMYNEGIHGSVSAMLTFENTMTAEVKCAWNVPIKEQRIVVEGEKGMLVFEDTRPWDQKLALFKNVVQIEEGRPVAYPQVTPEYIAVPQGEPLKQECQHFVNCIASRSRPITDGHESTAIIDIMERVDAALHHSSSIAA